MTAWLKMLGRVPMTEGIVSIEGLGGSSSRGMDQRGQSPARDGQPTPEKGAMKRTPEGEPDPESEDPRVRELQRKLKNVEPTKRGKRGKEPAKPWAPQGEVPDDGGETAVGEALVE